MEHRSLCSLVTTFFLENSTVSTIRLRTDANRIYANRTYASCHLPLNDICHPDRIYLRIDITRTYVNLGHRLPNFLFSRILWKNPFFFFPQKNCDLKRNQHIDASKSCSVRLDHYDMSVCNSWQHTMSIFFRNQQRIFFFQAIYISWVRKSTPGNILLPLISKIQNILKCLTQGFQYFSL